MLITLSDLHFCDNTTAHNISTDSFKKVLFRFIADEIGKGEIKDIQLVLAGDIFDLVRTDYWLKIPWEERPWNGTIDLSTGMNQNTSVIEDHYKAVLNNILNTNEAKNFISELNKLANSTIGVHVTYVIGNHDKAFNNFDSLKEILKSKLTGYTTPDKTFTFANSAIMPEYSAIIRHGNEWSEECYGWEFYNHYLKNDSKSIGRFDLKAYKVQSIGEVITAELMSGIIYNLECDGTDQKLIDLIRDSNNVRPEMDVFDWLGRKSTTLNDRSQKCIYNSLKKSLDAVQKTELAKKWDDLKTYWILQGDITDYLKVAYDLLRVMNYDSLHSWADKIKKIDKLSKWFESPDSLLKGAMCELENDKKKDYVIYGHSHSAGHCALGTNGNGKMKAYLNTGTYHSIIQKAKNGIDFAETPQVNVISLYSQEEQALGNPAVNVWNGIRYA